MKHQLLIATRNAHKAAEISSILGVSCLTLDDLAGAPEVVEDRETFAGNAQRKAQSLARWIGDGGGRGLETGPSAELLVLADDSGLEVDALDGAPGVRSARFAALDSGAGGNSSDADNNAKLLQLLAGVEKRSARFRCVMALVPVASPDRVEFFDGTCEGHIERELRGEGGFGYDPLFVPKGFQKSFAELGEAEKNRISHRAKALERLRIWLGRRAG